MMKMTKQTDKTVRRIAKEVGIPTWVDDRDRERVYCHNCNDYLTVVTKEEKAIGIYICEECSYLIEDLKEGFILITDEQRKEEYFDIHMPPVRED